MAKPDQIILTLSCENRPGIVARVSAFLFEAGFNILEASQFDDTATGQFFMRVVFNSVGGDSQPAGLPDGFQPIATAFGMRWMMRRRRDRRRVMLLFSKSDHCLTDLLYRWRTGEMEMEIAAIVSNHPKEEFAHIEFGEIPFHYLPVSQETKREQEARIWSLIEETGTDVVVLARYMQILSDELAAKLIGRCINIHHSFLPGFKGAKPYHQAFERGVKLIGATAHYVTSALDEGPIIEQDVERTSHYATPEDLIRKGRDIERRVLARALAWHLEDRVLLNGKRTVVFAD